MELNEIIDKKEPVKLDVLTVFIYSGISRLHDKKIPIKDMEEIKRTMYATITFKVKSKEEFEELKAVSQLPDEEWELIG